MRMPHREHRSQPRAVLLTHRTAGGRASLPTESTALASDGGAAMALHVIVGKGPVGHDDRRGAGRPGATRCGCSPAAAGASTDARRAPRRSTPPTPRPSPRPRAGADVALQRGQPGLPPLGDRLAAGRRRAARPRPSAPAPSWSPWRNLYGYGRPSGPMTPGHARWPRPTSRAGCAPGCGPTRSPRTRPAGCGSPRRAPRTSSARRCPPAQSHLIRQLPALRAGRRAWVVGDPDVAAQLGLPARRRRHAGHPRHRRAGAGPRLARAQHAAPRASGRRSTDLAAAMGAPAAPVSGIPWPVLRAVGARRPDDAGGRGRPAPVGPGVRHRRARHHRRPSG